jgi:hypothetical protein
MNTPLKDRIELAKIRRSDRLMAPSAPQTLTVPEWRRRAAEQVRSQGFVAVWATSSHDVIL